MKIEQLVLKTQAILNAPNYLQLMHEGIENKWKDFFKERPLIQTASFDHTGQKIDAEEKLGMRTQKTGAYLSVSKDETRIYLETCDYRVSTYARPLIWSISL